MILLMPGMIYSNDRDCLVSWVQDAYKAHIFYADIYELVLRDKRFSQSAVDECELVLNRANNMLALRQLDLLAYDQDNMTFDEDEAFLRFVVYEPQKHFFGCVIKQSNID